LPWVLLGPRGVACRFGHRAAPHQFFGVADFGHRVAPHQFFGVTDEGICTQMRIYTPHRERICGIPCGSERIRKYTSAPLCGGGTTFSTWLDPQASGASAIQLPRT